MGQEPQAWGASASTKRFHRCTIFCLSLLLGLCLAGSLAHAGDEEKPERVAKRACLAGDYAKGVAVLADLYVKTNNPVYIFNQGRCFEQSGKYEEAIIRFREYQLKVQDAGRVDPAAEKHITTCQGLLDAQRQKDRPAPAVVPVETRPSDTPVSAPPMPVEPALPGTNVASQGPTDSGQPDLSQAPSTSPRPGLRIAGLTALGVGVAGIATGLILNLRANSLAREIDDLTTEAPDLQSKESTRSRLETWGWVSYGVGGACLAGGAILTVLGYRHGGDSQVALVPAMGPGVFGAAMRGAF